MPNDELSNALPSYCYGDPALAYERKEGSTCKGCAHLVYMFNGQHCGKAIKRYPRKCRLYKDVTVGACTTYKIVDGKPVVQKIAFPESIT